MSRICTDSVMALTIVLLASSCTYHTNRFYPEIMKGPQPVTVTLTPKGTKRLGVTYLGCGNLVLEQDGEAIVTDPFWSNKKLLALRFRIKSNETYYGYWKANLESATARSAVQAMLVSHTHYDHVMDVPTLLHDHYFQNLKVVYGNRYMPQMLTHFSNLGVSLDSLKRSVVYDPHNSVETEWSWVSVTPKIRFLPIHSNHAPHTKRKLFMSKPLKPEHFKDNLVWHTDKAGGFKWTVGDTYSFLIDFIQTDTLRVFVQTSASSYPNGIPPAAVLKKKGVDIAFMCYASAPNVADYPNKWIDALKPKKLVLVHWEDFFKKPPADDYYRLVRRTKPHKVRERIDKLGKKADYFLMPKPGTKMDVVF